jgi:integrase
MKNDSEWQKIKNQIGLYLYKPSGQYFAHVRFGGKLYRGKLGTTDFDLAKRKLRDYRQQLERTDQRHNKTTLCDWLEQIYWPTLRGSDGAVKAKQRIITRIRQTWHFARTQPMSTLKKSQVLTWLNEHYGDWSESYWNSALSLIRDALDMAVHDRVLVENPVAALKYRKRKQPIRDTPTFEQFQQIVANIREQELNREAEDSGDFVEFLGLAGLGQAEAASIERKHVDLDAERISVYRHKTAQRFTIPIFPQLRPLVEKLCKNKANDRLFPINESRKALANACKRLGFPNFTHRSLRRMFITRAIERGIDVKTIAEWQGHRDGGVLILRTYSHVRSEHSRRMAQLMTTEQPANVVPMQGAMPA